MEYRKKGREWFGPQNRFTIRIFLFFVLLCLLLAYIFLRFERTASEGVDDGKAGTTEPSTAPRKHRMVEMENLSTEELRSLRRDLSDISGFLRSERASEMTAVAEETLSLVLQNVLELRKGVEKLEKPAERSEGSVARELEEIRRACAGQGRVTAQERDEENFEALANERTRPINGRKVEVIPGSMFGRSLARESLDGEWMSLKRVDEDDIPFFAWYGQHAIGQDPLLNYLRNPGSDEERIRGLFNRILRGAASRGNPTTDFLVLDVGANMGYYSLLAAAHGFRSLAFEPQPHCHQFFESAALLSGFSDRLTLVSGLVGDQPEAEMSVEVRTGCWGTWPIGDQDVLSKIPDPPPPVVVGETGVDEMLDALFTREGREIPRIPLMKVDTEGFEFRVLRSARRLLASGKVENLVVELNSNFYRRSGSGPEDAAEMFRFLHGEGYRMQCIDTVVGFSEKKPTSLEDVLRRAETLKDPYSVDCWWYHTRQAK